MNATIQFSVLLALVGTIAATTIAPITAITVAPAMAQASASNEIDRAIAEGERLSKEGSAESLRKAIGQLEKALDLARSAKAQGKQALAFLRLGGIHIALDEKQKAIDYLNQALPIWRAVGHRSGEATTLNNLGFVYGSLGEKQKAIDYLNQALPISRAVGDRSREATTLTNLGVIYDGLGEKQKAIDYYNQALLVNRAVGDQSGEATTLSNLGAVYSSLGEKQKAIDFHNQALPIRRAVGDLSGEAATLTSLGGVHDSLGEKQKAIGYFNQALPINRAVGDQSGEATTLSNLGAVHSSLGEKQKAIDFHNQALPIRRAVGDRAGEAITLNNLGGVHDSLGEKQKAIDYYNQALPIRRAVGDRAGEATTLHNLGSVYSDLGENQKAIDYYNQALSISHAVGDRAGEAITLNNLGGVYNLLGENQKAIDSYNQALPIHRAVENRSVEATTLHNLGRVYHSLGEKQKAIDFYNQALPIRRAVGDRAGEAITLSNLGAVYSDLGEKQKAIDFYNQSLPISRAVGYRVGEARTLDNLGYVLESQKQPEVAIVFFKQSVNLYESLRKDIKTLPRETQETYAKSVSGTYRRLADTLLTQGRIGEAQQVLELLKIQETKTYTRSSQSGAEIALSTSEQTILKTYDTLIAFGQDLRTCQTDPTCQNSPKLTKLLTQRNQQNQAFEKLTKTLEAELKKRLEKDIAFIDPNDPNNNLRRRAQELLTAQPGSLLIYPLVLDDKMWLLVASEGPILTRYEVKVTQTELANTVIAFRNEMKRCETQTCTAADTARTKVLSQKLYNWMFPAELQQAIKTAPKPITNLIFAPDRSTRYIPMGALYDGKKYLADTYSTSTIIAASKTETTARLPRAPKVLGLGLSQAVPGFNPLPSVPREINAIVKANTTDRAIFPGTKFFNNDFTQNILQTQLPRHDILHLATHGKFEPGDINKSFLVLGNGNHLPIQTIDTLDDLASIHLVVLSACETGLGDRREDDGIEIAGISNAFLQRGAKAVIASLWQVNDPATGTYMQRFYNYLSQPGISKVQALQNVSRDFITGKVTIDELNTFRASARPDVAPTGPIDLTHPYYWAPFILIGNGL